MGGRGKGRKGKVEGGGCERRWKSLLLERGLSRVERSTTGFYTHPLEGVGIYTHFWGTRKENGRVSRESRG